MAPSSPDPLTAEELDVLPQMRLDLDSKRYDAYRPEDVRRLLDIIDRLDRAARASREAGMRALRGWHMNAFEERQGHDHPVESCPDQRFADVLAALSADHDLVPYPTVGKFAEVRMIYCRRCGATQPVEAGDRPPLGPCVLAEAPRARD